MIKLTKWLRIVLSSCVVLAPVCISLVVLLQIDAKLAYCVVGVLHLAP